MIQFIKNWTLPLAILVGTALYLLFGCVPCFESSADVLGPICEAVFPLSVFATLFVTFSRVDFHLMRLRRWHIAVLLMQLLCIGLLVGTILMVVWAESWPSAKWVLEAVLTCVIAPCACAAPVVTSKLGGDLTQMTSFTLLSSLAAALLIPAVFPLLEPHAGLTFWLAFLVVLQRIASVLVLPLVLGFIVHCWVEPVRRWIESSPDLGFYCWAVSLALTTGITVRNIIHSGGSVNILLLIALLTLFTSLIQFALGRLIGYRFGRPVCAGQAMFQKNTALSIWVSWLYLTPLASIGAGFYVLWQNMINSYELWHYRTNSSRNGRKKYL